MSNPVKSNNGKYRFLFVSAPFSGVEVFLKNLQTIVAKDREIDATWIDLEMDLPELIAKLPPFSSNWTLKGGAVARSRVRALQRSGRQFDAAFFNHIIPPMFLGTFRRSVPSVVSLDVTPALMVPYSQWYFHHPPGREGLLRSVKEKFLHRMYRDVACILPWSDLVLHSLAADYGVPASKLRVVPPCIDISQWSPGETPRLRRTKAPGCTHILFVGADFSRKGGDLLMTVARRQEFAGCEFHVVTMSHPTDTPANVFIHSGMQANSPGLVDLYRNADLFVLPTRADFSPYAVIEAMATKLPVIATNVGALTEMVDDGESGYIIPAGDVSLLEDRIRRLCSDPALRERMGARGRSIVEERHDLAKNGAAIIGLLKGLACRARNNEEAP